MHVQVAAKDEAGDAGGALVGCDAGEQLVVLVDGEHRADRTAVGFLDGLAGTGDGRVLAHALEFGAKQRDFVGAEQIGDDQVAVAFEAFDQLCRDRRILQVAAVDDRIQAFLPAGLVFLARGIQVGLHRVHAYLLSCNGGAARWPPRLNRYQTVSASRG